jgi:fructose transport system substrate-binding protein
MNGATLKRGITHSRTRGGAARVRAGVIVLSLSALAACSSDAGNGDASTADQKVGVSLITMTNSVPYFIAMQDAAKAEAPKLNFDLTLAAGKQDGDEQGQIKAIEDAIAKGDKGILITPNGPGVANAIKQARDAGIYVIALEASLPASATDFTFATDNVNAGTSIGEWAAKSLNGKPARIAMLGFFNDKAVSFDYQRHQGFLKGMGIDVKDPKIKGDEAPTGKYSGGDYTIVCNEATNGAEEPARSALETCLTKDPSINVVFAGSEPIGFGAHNALKAAGKQDQAIILAVDGGCTGVKGVKEGRLSGTAQQYPGKMAQIGLDAMAKYFKDGTKPTVTPGLDFHDTGVNLVTDKPVDGVKSIDTTEGSKNCWG